MKILANVFNEDFGFFLKRLLAGFAGSHVETKVATVSALTDLVADHYEEIKEVNLIKLCNIGLLYLKENVKSLHRAVFKLIRKVISNISIEALPDVAATVIPALMAFPDK
jgi:hypothetical protein